VAPAGAVLRRREEEGTGAAPRVEHIVIELDDRDRRAPLLRVIGEIDQQSVDALYDVLDRHDEEADELQLDLVGVSFIASAGITFLLRAARHLAIRVVGASRPVRQVLDMTRLSEPFGLDGDTDAQLRIS
jgi:anti-anti-sigma factor